MNYAFLTIERVYSLERDLLTLATSKSEAAKVVGSIATTAWLHPGHGRIAQAILELITRGEAVGHASIAALLGEEIIQDYFGDWSRFTDCISSPTATLPAEQYRRLIEEQAAIRKLEYGLVDAKRSIVQGHSLSDVAEKITQALPIDSSRSRIVTYAEIEAQPLEWLWPDYIPLGAITLIDGNPDLGKSFFTVDLATRVSRGWRMPPDGGTDSDCEPAGVVMASAEDDPARTIRPRLEAAGADLARVTPMTMLDGHPLVLPDNLKQLEATVRTQHAKLVVIDPLFAFLTGKVDTKSDHAIRRAMHLLKEMAERSRCAVVIVRHLNKRSSDCEPIFRGGGSIGILGASRSTLLLGPHPTETEIRVVARIKGNLSPQPPALAFRFESIMLPTGQTARLSWIGEVEVDTAELLKHHGGKRQGKTLEAAISWLASQLIDGAKTAQIIENAASNEGISESTLKRAKRTLGVKSDKPAFTGGWLWELPAKGANSNLEAVEK